MKLKPLIWIAVVLVVIVGVRVIVSRLNAPSDQELIQTALAESIKASKEGRPGGVMDLLSRNLKLNDMDTSGNRGQIAQFIRENQPDVNVENKHAVIAGDEAQIISPVQLEMNFLGNKMSRNLDEVTLIFKRESDMEYLIFPTKKWKLAEVRVPEDAVQQLMAQ
jgi:hypothetical protein